jgi:hypothetical protein
MGGHAVLPADERGDWAEVKRRNESRRVWTLALQPSRSGCHWTLSWHVRDARGKTQRRVTLGDLRYATGDDSPTSLINDLQRIVNELRRRYEPRAERPRSPRGGYGGDEPFPELPSEAPPPSHRLDQGLPY